MQTVIDSLGVTESGNNYGAKNSEGYTGKYQFGPARLRDYMNSTGRSFSMDQFQNDPALQEQVMSWHVSDIMRQNGDLVGKTVNGIPMTEGAIVAMSHLGGVGGARQYVETGGAYNPADSNGTSLSDYASTHGGSGIGTISLDPAVQPGQTPTDSMFAQTDPEQAKRQQQADLANLIARNNESSMLALSRIQQPVRTRQLLPNLFG